MDEEQKRMREKFLDFARDEIYAFHRLTAILTTFFMAAGLTVLAIIKGGDLELFVRIAFIFLFCTGGINIVLVWWRLKRTIFNYYQRLATERHFKLTKTCKKIEQCTGCWQEAIWWTFLVCFVSFGAVLVSVMLTL